MFSQMSLYGKLAGLVGIFGVIWGGYLYVSNLQSKVELLSKENTALTISNNALIQSQERVRDSLNNTKKELSTLDNSFKESRKEKEAIIRLFGNHNFEKLLRAKPTWMGKKMSKATSKIYRSIESESD